ncbi:MAG: nuclear transport factor 2 family protein [Acidovorax sp.]|uniref:nuclear transport factor 2 family protein n=1 Tax=Acidovorax sp. TaxID=1872122 RepID=UPI002622C2F4|nr:nuclear transport factor 2 family protein [Acidovorax sp.]MDH4465487.1 nuclear transport factor 2 family protein [Acidovorax sp.]
MPSLPETSSAALNHAQGPAEEAVTRVIALFENLSSADVARMSQFYAADARFKDPFNDVRGVPAIGQIFAHMFVALENPRFIVTGRVVQGNQCFLTWDFLFAFKSFHKGVTQTVRGASHLVFDGQGLVSVHRDYWDAAEELYEKLPVVSTLMRWLKKRANS